MIDFPAVADVLAGLLESLEQAEGAWVYGLVVAGLVLGACGVPVPEEAILAVGGALAARGQAAWMAVWLVGWAAIVALDVVLHALGARLGPAIERSPLGARVGPHRWAQVRAFMARRGVLAVVGARFVMGLRIPTFLLAGATGMPLGRFVPAVALPGLVSTGLPVLLGHILARRLPDLIDGMEVVRWVLLGVVLLAILMVVLVRRRA